MLILGISPVSVTSNLADTIFTIVLGAVIAPIVPATDSAAGIASLTLPNTIANVALNGGSISGTGAVGNLSGVSSTAVGSVTPGNTPVTTGDVLNVNGNVSWGAGTKLNVYLDDPSNSHPTPIAGADYTQVNVNGAVTSFDGALLGGSVGPDNVDIGDSFTILQSTSTLPTGHIFQNITGLGGLHAITEGGNAFLSGDKFIVNYTNNSIVLTRELNNATVVITSSTNTIAPFTSQYGQDVVFTATITPEPGTSLPTSNDVVTFVLDGMTYTSSSAFQINPLTGVGTITFDPQVQLGIIFNGQSSHTIGANFSAPGFTSVSSTTDTRTQTVIDGIVTISLTTLVTPPPAVGPVYGQPITIVATVTPSGLPLLPGANLPTGDVTFQVDNQPVSAPIPLTLAETATYTITMPPNLAAGPHTVYAQYVGDPPGFNGDANYSATGNTGVVIGTTVLTAGSNYTSAPVVTFVGGGTSTPATGIATISNGSVTGISLTSNVTSTLMNSSGSGYGSAPTVTFVGGLGAVSGVAVTSGGAGYSFAPTVTFSGGGLGIVTGATVTTSGSGYTSAPAVTFTGGGATVQATGTATISASGLLTGITITSPGSGYTSVPTITLTGGNFATPAAAGAIADIGTQATGIATISASGQVTGIVVVTTGSGYTSAPIVTITGGGATVQATATASIYIGTAAMGTANISGGAVTGITITNPGSGYVAAPTIVFTGGNFSIAATASANITTGGSGYTSVPVITLTGGGGTGASAAATLTQFTDNVFVNKNTTVVQFNTPTYTTAVHQAITVTALVGPDNGYAGTPTGSVSFYNGAAIPADLLGTAVVPSNGVVNFTIPASFPSLPNGLPVNISGYNLIAVYTGDSNFLSNASNPATATLIVTKSPTTIAFAANSPSGVTFGQTTPQLQLKATLTYDTGITPSPAGEAVTFLADETAPNSGGTVLGTGTLNAAGLAILNYPATALAPGVHTIYAIYSGANDANFAASISAGLTFTVFAATPTVKVTASPAAPPATDVYSQPVTLTATLSSTSGVPSFGPVQFFDNGNNITGTLLQGNVVYYGNGTYQLVTTALLPGIHAIFAYYPGSTDGSFAPSIGTLSNYTVSPDNTTTTVTANPGSGAVNYGQVINFTATVKPVAPGTGMPQNGDVVNFVDTTTNTFLGQGSLSGGTVSSVSLTGVASVALTNNVTLVTITGGGAGYTSAPLVTFNGGGYTTLATGTAVILNNQVVGVNVTNPGAGYTSAPTITFAGGGGAGANASAFISPGGAGYLTPPVVAFTGGGATTQATATASITDAVGSVTIANGGSGYTAAPMVTFTGGGAATQATGIAILTNGVVTGVQLTNYVASASLISGGAGYTSAPTVVFSGGGALVQATGTAVISGGAVVGIIITSQGNGYTSAPNISLFGGGFTTQAVFQAILGIGGSGYNVNVPTTIIFSGAGFTTPASAVANLTGVISGINIVSGGTGYTAPPTLSLTGGGFTTQATAIATLNSGGAGYTSAPTVTFSAPTGVGVTATGTAIVAGGAVTAILVNNPGSGYTSPPTVTLTGGGFTTAATATALISGSVATYLYTYPPLPGGGVLNAGSHNITATFGGDAGFNGSSGSLTGYQINNAPTITTVGSNISSTSPANPAFFGQPITFSATVTAANGGQPAAGTVTFYDGATILATVKVPASTFGNTATYVYTPTTTQMTVATHNITAMYSGGLNFAASPLSVAFVQPVVAANTGITLTSNSPGNISVIGQAVTFTATVAVQPPTLGSTLVNSGSVVFKNGTYLGTSTMATVAITSGGVSGVTFVNEVNSVAITNTGTGYAPTAANPIVVTFTGGGTNTQATGNAVVVGGQIIGITITNPGSGYVTAPTISISGGGGAGATALANIGMGGIGYTQVPTVTFSPSQSGGITATGFATIASGVITGVTLTGVVSSATIIGGGAGYTSAALVSFSGGGATTQATAVATVAGGVVTSIRITNMGSGYTSPPVITLSGGGASTQASVSANLTIGGSGYTITPTIKFTGGGAVTTLAAAYPDIYGIETFTANTTQVGQLTGGTNEVSVIYSGSVNFAGAASAVIDQTVLKAATITVAASPVSPITYGQTTTLNVTLAGGLSTPPPSGTLTITDTNNSTVPPTTTTLISNATVGTAAPSFTLGAGSHTLTVFYSGDTFFAPTNKSLLYTVKSALTTTTLASSFSGVAEQGQPITFTATVNVVSAGGGTATSNVTFYSGTNLTVLGTVPLSGGATNTASITVSNLPINTFTGTPIIAIYNGSSAPASTAEYASSISSSVFQKVTTGPSLGTLPTVAWTAGTNYSSNITITGGSQPYAAPVITSGTYPPGLNAPNPIGKTINLSGTPTIPGVYTFTMSVTDSVGATATKTYTITINNTLSLGALSSTIANFHSPFSATIPISGGTPGFILTPAVTGLPTTGGWSVSISGANVKISASSPTAQGTFGPINISVRDASGTFATGQYFITVQAAAATAKLTASSAGPWLLGRPDTFTAAITSPAGNPTTGSVSFYDAGNLLTTVNLNGTNVASTAQVLPQGGHQIYAVYNGSANYTMSANSNAISQTVVNTSISAVTASNTKPAQGANVTFTVIVNGYGGGVPAGNVTFIDTTTGITLGTVTLNGSGIASLVTNSLSPGTHKIVAVFNGQAGPPEWDATGDSTPVTVTVKGSLGGRLV